MGSPSTTSGRFLGEGKYELLTPIGLGAMGIVHLARHVALDRVVAIKLLNPGLTARPEAADRFLNEARTASLLRHKNTTHVLDFGGDQARGFYLVMEYVEGHTLADVVAEEGTLTPARGINIAAQVLAALAEAHEFDIVHRDIKPGNVMLVPWTDDDGRQVELVKVLDFGIATMHAEPRWAMKEEVTGTPEYMSPEQAQGLPVDQRSDVYAVGTLLYALVCGEVPFARETPMETMVAQVSSEPRPPRSLAPGLSEQLERTLLRALAKKPEDRFQSARAFRAALLELPEAAALAPEAAQVPATVVQSAPATRPGLVPAPTPEAAPRRSRVWLPVAAAAVVAGVIVAWRLLAGSPSPPSAEPIAAEGVATLERPPSPPVVAPAPAPAPTVVAEADVAPPPAPTVAPVAPPQPGPTVVLAPPAPWPTLPPVAVTPPAPHEEAPERPDGREAKPKPIEPKPTKPQPAPIAPPVEPAIAMKPAPSEPTEPKPVEPTVPKPVEPTEPKPVEPIAPEPGPVAPASPALAATAKIGGVSVEGSLPRSAVARALDAARPGLEQCYKTAATAAHADAAGSAGVRLVIDIDGRARSVSVGGLPLPGLQACATQVLGRVRTKDRPDTGTVSASFELTFTPKAPR
ncbi:MAG: protein kinase [Deltaproteobacteria bacterium]|nr:protein kinase [Deltaproteobacteria bacterium]